MKSVLITGTNKGLGRELLKVFLENGWLVYAVSRKIDSFQDITDAYKNSCIPIKGDVTNDDVAIKINRSIKENTSSLDVLINNAGIAELCFGIENVNAIDLENHFKVHVSGAFRVAKACLPYLKKVEQGCIINVSSRKGSINRINSGIYRILMPYQVAKCAQNMLTACLNQELKETNILTYAIHPGNLKTDSAPPDADTEPSLAADKLYQWINTDKKPPGSSLYSVMDDTIIEW